MHIWKSLGSLLLTLLAAPLLAETPETAMAKIAAQSGLDAWPAVETVAFTFHVTLPNKTVERSWQWWPATGRVVMAEGGVMVADYIRGAEADPSVDPKFVNDLYWLSFPFVVVWDETVTLERIEPGHYTAGIEAAGALRVVYPEGIGYTPGDIYEVYYDADYRMTHWVFRKGGHAEPNLVTTWEAYEAFGPLSLATEHRAYPEGDFHLWFTDVVVTTR